MPRFHDPYDQLGTVKPETDAEAKRRRARARQSEVEELAHDLLHNDPTVSTMAEARRKARELIELHTQVDKGLRDPQTGELTKEGKKQIRERSGIKETNSPSNRARARTTRPTRRGTRRVRKLVRATAAPFGSATSAGWTLVTGGLGLVLLYVALRDAGTVSAFLNALSGGIRRISDPYEPLVPKRHAPAPRPQPTHRAPHTQPRRATAPRGGNK